MVMSFNESLKHGKIGESLIARWLQNRGWYVIPIYEKQIDDGKGPRVYAPQGKKIIAPDALIMHPDTRRVMFVECKRKSVFSWYRKTQQWQTGIDLKHWQDYLQLYSQTGYEIWLLFLHEHSEKKGWDEPYPCPVGLFGQDIGRLKSLGRIGGEHAKGMIYWNYEDLVCLAPIDEVMSIDSASASLSPPTPSIPAIQASASCYRPWYVDPVRSWSDDDTWNAFLSYVGQHDPNLLGVLRFFARLLKVDARLLLIGVKGEQNYLTAKMVEHCKLLEWAAKNAVGSDFCGVVIEHIPDKYDELNVVWARVVSVVQPMGTRVLMQQGSLVFLDQTTARVGINSRPLFKLAQHRVDNLANAFEAVLGRKIDVCVEVLDSVFS